MLNNPQTFVKLDDAQIIALIDTAQERLVYMAPGLDLIIAETITTRWHALGISHVKVILDVDPEVARMGYGSLEGLEYIHESAARLGGSIYHQAGLRIGLLIVDNSMVVFTPRPLLIEAGSTQGFQPNAIFLERIPPSLLNDIGWVEQGDSNTPIDLSEVTDELIKDVKADLLENPPQKFNITRIVRVFNSRFEFVEIEVLGCSITRKTATIPKELMVFISDHVTRNKIHATYQIIEEGSELSGKKIHDLRKKLVDSWIINIPGYGNVVLRKNKDKLLEGIEELRREVEKFQREIRDQLQGEIERSCNGLIQSLLPYVIQNPPQNWRKFIGMHPSDEEIESKLTSDLLKAFGSAEEIVRNMEVRVIFKGVTYEMLNDLSFIAEIHKAIPSLLLTHDEFDAARSVQPTLF